jgi:hypothetical protein
MSRIPLSKSPTPRLGLKMQCLIICVSTRIFSTSAGISYDQFGLDFNSIVCIIMRIRYFFNLLGFNSPQSPHSSAAGRFVLDEHYELSPKHPQSYHFFRWNIKSASQFESQQCPLKDFLKRIKYYIIK